MIMVRQSQTSKFMAFLGVVLVAVGAANSSGAGIRRVASPEQAGLWGGALLPSALPSSAQKGGKAVRRVPFIAACNASYDCQRFNKPNSDPCPGLVDEFDVCHAFFPDCFPSPGCENNQTAKMCGISLFSSCVQVGGAIKDCGKRKKGMCTDGLSECPCEDTGLTDGDCYDIADTCQ